MKNFRLVTLALLVGLLASSLQAQLTFSKIADYSTAIPNGAGNFTSFGDPAIYGSNVAFYAQGTGNQSGIYYWNGSTLSRVVDTNTAVPSSTGNFTNITFYDYSVSSNGAVLLRSQGPAATGIYKSSGGTLSRVVDTSFAIPGGSGNFTGTFAANESSGISAFVGNGNGGQQGIYTISNGIVTKAVDTNSVLPGAGANFSSTDFVVNDGGSLAFWTYYGSSAIYSYTSSSLHLIANTNTAVPGTAFKFGSFQSPPGISSTTVTFIGSFNGFNMGIFSANADGTGLTRLVDTSMTAPGSTNQFKAFYGGYGFVGGTLCFAVNFAPNYYSGIYTLSSGTLAKVLAPGDSLEGKTVRSCSLGSSGFAGGGVAIQVTFTDNTSSLYATSIGGGGTGNTALSFTSQASTAGGFQMNLSLTAGQNYRLQGTTTVANTNSWTTLTNISSAPASVQFTDTAATNLPARYYRIISP